MICAQIIMSGGSELRVGLFGEVSAEEAKKAAQKILSNPKYRPPERQPRPVSRLGQLERRIFSAIGDFFNRLIPGSGFIQWLLLAILVGCLAWVIAKRLMGRTKRVRSATELSTPGLRRCPRC